LSLRDRLNRLPRTVLIAGGSVLAAAAVITTSIIVLNNRQANSSGLALPPPNTSTIRPSSSAPSSGPPSGLRSTQPPTSPTGPHGRVLPASRPLRATELIVPMESNGTLQLYLADIREPAPVKKLTTASGPSASVMLAPDRRTFLYLTGPDDQHRDYRFAAATKGSADSERFAARDPRCAGGYFRGAWNPADPTMIAVPCLDASGAYGLYLMRTDGTIIRPIAIGTGYRADDPAFSPDGHQLVYWAAPAGRSGGGGLYSAPTMADGAPRELTPVASNDADPAFSPDGSTIAFRRRTAGNSDIYTMPADGSGRPVRIIHTSGDDQDPTWSPSGKQLAYKSDAPSSYPGPRLPRIWIADADGSHRHLLWTEGAPGAQAASAWSRR
jgi:Tol biopolymer transport system component